MGNAACCGGGGGECGLCVGGPASLSTGTAASSEEGTDIDRVFEPSWSNTD